jgi:hypothetical protein
MPPGNAYNRTPHCRAVNGFIFYFFLGGIIAMYRPAHARPLALLSFVLFATPLAAQETPASDPIIAKIREEGLQRSQAMQTLSYLTDVIGPRLTGSPNLKRANEWTRDKMTSWGLQNASLEAWGPFGRGWTLERFSAQIVSPQCIPVIAYPKAWSPGVRGTLTGEVVVVNAETEAELDKYKGKLKGAIVLNGAPRAVQARFEPLGTRYTDEALQRMANAQPGQGRGRFGGGGPGGPGGNREGGGAPGGAPPGNPPPGGGPDRFAGGRPGGPQGGQPGNFAARQQFASRKTAFFQEEGVALLIDPSRNGDGGTIFVQSVSVPTVESGRQGQACFGVGQRRAEDHSAVGDGYRGLQPPDAYD